MELFDNKFVRHLIGVGQCKLKDKIAELLILVRNWSQLGGFFSNSHICEGLSLETEVPPQVDNDVFVLNCNFIFLLRILLKCFPFIDCINVNSTSLQLLLSISSPSPIWGMGPKKLVPGEFQYIFFWSNLLCFYSVALMSLFDISVSFVGFSPFVLSYCLFGYFLTPSNCYNLRG